jgi:hypothetical protein
MKTRAMLFKKSGNFDSLFVATRSSEFVDVVEDEIRNYMEMI